MVTSATKRGFLKTRSALLIVGAVFLLSRAVPAAGKTDLTLPLGRSAYQTNEAVHLVVVRSAEKSLPAGPLVLAVAGDDGSELSFDLAVPAVAAVGARAAATEHLYLNARLLRPGRYGITATVDGSAARTTIDVFSHVRRSSYRLVNWGRAKGKHQLAEGEDSLGFNLFYGHYASDKESNFIRAGVDFMRCCTMSGGHQMDLRSECDWSDPYVIRGGAVRVVRQALADRTRPNVSGVHFYDEPGLTWRKDPATGKMTPHGLPSQIRGYESAFGVKPLGYREVDPKNPDHVARWRHFARWKLGFMDSAWKVSQFGVSYVRPDYLSVTQSQYGFTAFTDGYYFNVARSLPIVSGHGGYHDYGLMLFNPSYMLEFARARDLAKPCWYLPCWYGSTTSEQFRLEQYLAFQTGIQGLITPPDIDPYEPHRKPAADGVVETNKIAARLGTIFNTMAVTRPPVAVLYSLSHSIRLQTNDRSFNYAHADDHVKTMGYVYLAGKITQRQFFPVVEEDIVDGTLAAHHKAVIIPDVDYLPPKVLTALEAFAADGGMVLLAGKCEVKIKGAVDLGIKPRLADQEIVDKLIKARKYNEMVPYVTLGKQLNCIRPLAEALDTRLKKAGIGPIFSCDNPGIVATRQAAGDVEYLFAVNAAIDRNGPRLNTQPAAAKIALSDDGRSVYDAVLGGKARVFVKEGGKLRAAIRFGPGQMRVFARTARPIGSIRASTPVIKRDYTLTETPLSVEIGAVLLGADGGAISGSVPLRISVTDPLGAVRYDLYRATRLGMLTLTLPLAANDTAGKWTVSIRELLAGTESKTAFELRPVLRCAALAGRKTRAIHFGRDRDNIFRFFRVHRKVTIATGSGDYNHPAAERLAKILEPWGVKCTIAKAADLNKPRDIPEKAVATWVGLEFGRVATKKPKSIARVGFAVDGPVILLGTPADNPLIAHLLKRNFLPYTPMQDLFPGRGRGMLAWQRDGIGHGIESVTIIAHDPAGMAEAVGTLYEAQAGIEPLTALQLPLANKISQAAKADISPEAKLLWQVNLPDRAAAMKVIGDKLTVLTWDRSVTTIDTKGRPGKPAALNAATYAKKLLELKPAPEQAAAKLARDNPVSGRIVKHAATGGKLTAIAYWGGLVRIVDAKGKCLATRQCRHDIAALTWFGDTFAVALSDGRVIGVTK